MSRVWLVIKVKDWLLQDELQGWHVNRFALADDLLFSVHLHCLFIWHAVKLPEK